MRNEKKNENLEPLYPFNGRSTNLIDKFYIFGYNYLTLKKYLLDQNPKISEIKLNNQNIGVFKFDEEPSILYEITHDFNKQIIGPDEIKKFISPNNLFICFRPCDNEEYNNDDILLRRPATEKNNFIFSKIDLSDDKGGNPKSFRSVFSCCPIEGENRKKCQNGIGYTFYRRFWKKKKLEILSIFFIYPILFVL